MASTVGLLVFQTAGFAAAQPRNLEQESIEAFLEAVEFVPWTPVADASASGVTDDVELGASSVVVTCPTPPDPQPTPRFDDVPAGATHANNIACVGRWGIAQGTSSMTYEPRKDVTREQMATFVANLIRATGTSLPDGRNRFSDLTSAHRANVNALANAGIVNGVGGGRYGSRDNVTRAQAATILAGAYRFVRGTDLPEGPDRFQDDDGNRHEANINRLANVGVIGGLTEREYGPANPLKREQMASLLARFLTPITGPTGTVWYSEYGELRSINMASPAERRLVYEFGILDTFTVNTVREEFVYIDDRYNFDTRETYNEVYVRSARDTSLRVNFRWGDQCLGEVPDHVAPPLSSPDGNWFISDADYDFPLPDPVEIRGRDGSCVFAFPQDLFSSWTWMANGDLLAVMDVADVGDVSGDNALVVIPRAEIASGGDISTIHLVRAYSGPTLPSTLSVANQQDQVAYSYDRDLYVLDIGSGKHHRVARGSADLMWPAFSPDDQSIILRHRTFAGGPLTPSSGQVHLVPNHRASAIEIRSDGPTMLRIPDRSGGTLTGFDAKGPFFWAG